VTDQDPPIEPLRRLDPAEPDEHGVGRLERLDPEAEGSASAAAAAAPEATAPKARSRLRDGLTAAITLATLLSLSSIAAIGGLVAVSMRSAPPGGIETVAPMDAEPPLTTIRVGESAQGAPEEPGEPDPARPSAPPQEDDSVVEFTPVAPPSPVNEGGGTGGGGNGGGNGDGKGAGSAGGGKGAGGAWCDARVGDACDATAPGSVLGPAAEPEDGYIGGEEDDVEDDDPEDDDQSGTGGSSSRSGHSGKSH
jgi:hypothetical protein